MPQVKQGEIYMFLTSSKIQGKLSFLRIKLGLPHHLIFLVNKREKKNIFQSKQLTLLFIENCH